MHLRTIFHRGDGTLCWPRRQLRADLRQMLGAGMGQNLDHFLLKNLDHFFLNGIDLYFVAGAAKTQHIYHTGRQICLSIVELGDSRSDIALLRRHRFPSPERDDRPATCCVGPEQFTT